jgi:NAD(P)H-hydrate epimerase
VSLADDWSRAVEQVDRCAALVVGPGLAVDGTQMLSELHQLLAMAEAPVVVDAGGLRPDVLDGLFESSVADDRLPVLTPHDGEFERLTGRAPGPDRVDDVRRAAAELGAVVLLKGPTTVVAHPDGQTLLSTAGDQRLATAGTGDVLSGIIGAGLALGLDPFLAAGLGAELHGRSAGHGRAVGLTAGDLPDLVADLLSSRQPSSG